MKRIRIMLVDDHPPLRQGLAELLRMQRDMTVVGEAHNGEEAVELVPSVKPDIILMDIEMPGRFDGVEATRRITAQYPYTKIIMLTIHTEEEYLFEAIKAGAKSYLLKSVETSEVVDTIRVVFQGDTRLDATLATKILDEFRRVSSQPRSSGTDFIHLTDREREILRLVGQGAHNAEIAAQLGIAEKTVRNRLSIIFDKLHLNNRVEAALYATREGLTTRDLKDKPNEGNP